MSRYTLYIPFLKSLELTKCAVFLLYFVYGLEPFIMERIFESGGIQREN